MVSRPIGEGDFIKKLKSGFSASWCGGKHAGRQRRSIISDPE